MPKTYTGATELSGSASGHFGDVYEHGTKYNIQHNHYYGPADNTQPHKALTNYAHGRHGHSTGKGLALLSFDGGPHGGLSKLLVLKHFMERVAEMQGLQNAPKPCEFFDMISGAGVGGLLALLLGSLELTVDHCIERYLHFSESVLNSRASSGHNVNDTNAHCGSAVVDDMVVERFMKQTLRDRGESEGRLLQASSAVSCRVCVKVTIPRGRTAEMLRSYQTQTIDDTRLAYIKVWQAAQATLATSPLYHPITIHDGSHDIVYGTNTDFQDTDLQYVLNEAQTCLLDRGQALADHLDCLVSIGSKTRSGTTHTSPANFSMDTSSDVFMADILARMGSTESNSSTRSAGQFCRLEVPVDLSSGQGSLLEDHTKAVSTAKQYFDYCDTDGRLEPSFRRLSRHQLTPGFAMIQEPQQQLEFSAKARALPQPEQISSYNARTSHYRRSQPRVKDTCTWIFKDRTFVDWCRAPRTSTLICTGTVGCGKSILAAAIIDHMQELFFDTPRFCIHYFFETGTSSSSALDELMRAIIKQMILSGIPLNRFSTAINEAFKTERLPPPTEELIDLVKLLIDHFPPSVYLIDGFDGLDELQLQDMFSALRRVFDDNNSHGSKLVLVSREVLGRGIDVNHQLTGLSQVYTIRLTLAHLSNDIARFVEAQVNEQQIRRIITRNEKLLKDIKKKLKANSEKILVSESVIVEKLCLARFLWIHFQIRTIWDPRLSKNDTQIRALIENLPNGLDKTYEMCLRRIEDHEDPDHRELAAKALRWVFACSTPLTTRQAREVVSMDQSNVELPESGILNACVTEYCANLLTTDLTNRQVLFTHASVKQFLSDRAKISPDLMRFHMKPVDAERECATVCLTYLDTIDSRKQLMIRQGADIKHLAPKVVKMAVSMSPTVASMAQVFMRRPPKTNIEASIPKVFQSSSNPVKLEIYDYFLNNWLSLTSNIALQDSNSLILRRLCQRVDPNMFPWIRKTADECALYQQIAQHSVIHRHLPLLRAVQEHLRTHKRGILRSVFESHCPGTRVRLVHMAAALGFTDILAQLMDTCDVDAYDDEIHHSTPLACAAERSHFVTVEWLLVEGRIRNTYCRMSLKYGVSLLTILAGLDTEDGFFRLDHIDEIYNPRNRENFSQALFAACAKGHVGIASRLVVLGARTNKSASFYWPGTGVYYSSKTMIEIAVACKNFLAFDTLLKVNHYTETHDDHQQYLDHAVDIILEFTALEALASSDLSRTLKIIDTLLQREASMSAVKAKLSSPVTSDSQQLIFRKFLRNVLCTRAARDCKYRNLSELLCLVPGPSNQNLISEELMICLLRLGYTLIDYPILGTSPDPAQITHLLFRGSSRVFLELVDMVGKVATEDLSKKELTNLNTRLRFFSVATIEAIIYKLYAGYRGSSYTRIKAQSFDSEPMILSLREMYSLPSYVEVQIHFGKLLSTRPSDQELFHIARCYRTCRKNIPRTERMYVDLKHIPDNCDLSLNFPSGYERLYSRYVIKRSVVMAFYRWNYRLRRRKGHSRSVADKTYIRAIANLYPSSVP